VLLAELGQYSAIQFCHTGNCRQMAELGWQNLA
jgi:hypothetical protein